jgi:hypothetical protein
VLYLSSKRATAIKCEVQQKIAAKHEEKIAFDEVAEGLESLSESAIAYEYKTNEEIKERCDVILKEEGKDEMVEFLSNETFARERLIDYLEKPILDIQMKYPTFSSDAQQGKIMICLVFFIIFFC